MTTNSQWTALWFRDGELVCFESFPWNGGSGGFGFTECTLPPSEWLPGEYEVQIFVGETWKVSGYFTVTGTPPTSTPTLTTVPTNTSEPIESPTATTTPTSAVATVPSRTVLPTLSPQASTFTPTVTRTPVPTPFVTISPTIQPTPTRYSTFYR